MADDENEVNDPNYNPEEEVVGDFKPILGHLPVVKNEVDSDEIEITKFRTKLYRFRDKQWKERGVGDLKIQ